jgi:hypothetical protein
MTTVPLQRLRPKMMLVCVPLCHWFQSQTDDECVREKARLGGPGKARGGNSKVNDE